MSQTQISAQEEIFGYHGSRDEVFCTSRRYEYISYRRYYVILLTQDLFGEWSVMRVYGGLDSNKGGSVITGFADYGAAMKKIAQSVKRWSKKTGQVVKDKF